MAQLSHLIQEERLVGFQFDTNHILNVLNEIVNLFQDQSKRLDKIEDQLPEFAYKEDLTKLDSDFGKYSTQTDETLLNIKKDISTFKDQHEKDVRDIEKIIEDGDLTGIAETRRLVTNELASYVPAVHENDPVIVKLKSLINNSMNQVKKLSDDFDEYTIPKIGQQQTQQQNDQPKSHGNKIIDNNNSNIRMTQCERRIQDLEARLINFPTLEGDITALQLQVPSMSRRLEKRINDIQAALEKVNIKVISSHNKDDKFIEANATVTSSKLNSAGAGDSNSSITSFVRPSASSDLPKPFEPMFDDLKGLAESLPKTQLTEVMPELEPHKPLTIQDIENMQSGTLEGTASSIPSNPSLLSFKDDSTYITPVPSDPIVKVYETHTHVSELNSSVRVVSELEWCTKAINQHHEAIRQLQQGLRTQQENFDTITENLMKVNTTHNTRISQLAQQQLRAHQDLIDLRKQISDQLISLQQQIFNNPRTRVIEKTPSQNESLDLSSVMRTPEEKNEVAPKPQGSSVKKTVLPPLQQQARTIKTAFVPLSPPRYFDDEDDSDEIIEEPRVKSSKSTKSVKSSKSSKSFLRSFEEEEVQTQQNEFKKKEGQKNKFTLSTTHFSANIQDCMAPVIVSTIKNDPMKNDSRNRIDNIEIYTYIAPTQHQKSQKGHGQKGDQAKTFDDYDLTPNELGNKPPPIINGDVINFGRIGMRQHRLSGGFTIDQDTNEMIEERVSMLARKTIAILADKAKQDMREQESELKKLIDQVLTQIDGKIDREFVERMFNKFRVMLNDVNEKLENLQCSFLEWVTRDELEMVLQKFIGVISDVKDAAATKTKYNCLLCGRPRQHLSGMMVRPDRPETTTLPSEKPTTAVKPGRHLNTNTRDIHERRAKTSQGSQIPRDVVQYLTLT